MKIIKSINEWQTLRAQTIFDHKKIGFIPTMGNLHAGHKSLLTRSVQENEITVLSIFVNPTQFDNKNDLEKYPKTLDEDKLLAEQCGVPYLFLPDEEQLYPDFYHYQIHETKLSHELCGRHRPGHFNGVLTVVLKLLNLVKPNVAYFGEKDFQQLQLIKKMIEALFLDIEIIACPTVRDENGLALSSRNSRLSSAQYQLALNFPKLLKSASGCKQIIRDLISMGFFVDYIEEHQGRRFGAVRIGEVRLIDNVRMDLVASVELRSTEENIN